MLIQLGILAVVVFLGFLFFRGRSKAWAVTTSSSQDRGALKALAAAIVALRKVVKDGNAAQISEAVETFKANVSSGDLESRELASEVFAAEYMISVVSYLERINKGEGLQAVATMSDGEPSFYRNPVVVRERTRDEDVGSFDIGEKGIFYDGSEKMLTIVWSKVLTIGVDRELLIVHPSSGGNPHRFGMRTPQAAKLAQMVATTMLKRRQEAAPAPRRKRAASAPAPTLPAFDVGDKSGRCNFHIVGEASYQGRLRKVCEDAGRTFTALVMAEPTNAFDPNAVRVATGSGDTIGYFSREDAVRYKPAFDLLARHGHVGSCSARLIGGEGEKRSFGVILSLREHDDLLMEMRDRFEPGTAVAGAVNSF